MTALKEILDLVERFDRNRDAYKDVIHEDAIKVGGYTKAPDYCFRIGEESRS